jgi:hypothetical protein
MERRHFLKLAFGFVAGAAALAASARAAPLMPHPLAEDGPLSPSNEDARPAVTNGDDVEHLKPEEVRGHGGGHGRADIGAGGGGDIGAGDAATGAGGDVIGVGAVAVTGAGAAVIGAGAVVTGAAATGAAVTGKVTQAVHVLLEAASAFPGWGHLRH